MNDKVIHILYIEDDNTDIEIFKSNIKKIHTSNIYVSYANNYEEFSEKNNLKKFDIYFIDLYLNGNKDGIAIARDIRNAGVKEPIVLLTGADQYLFNDSSSSEIIINDHILKEEITSSLLERVVLYNIANFENVKENDRLQRIENHAQKIQSLGVLAGGVAHELNNFIQPIGFAAENIKESVENDSFLTKQIDIILKNTDKCAILVNNILGFSSIGGGDKKEIVMSDLLLKSVKESTSFFNKSVSFETLIADDVLDKKVLINSGSFQHVITNILMNASQAMAEKGCVTITLSSSNANLKRKEIDLSNDVQNYLLLTIQDDGPGIPNSVKHRIFDPFFTTKEVGKGTGLGLSIVHNIIKEWGGHIELGDVPNGACFNIYIPVYEA